MGLTWYYVIKCVQNKGPPGDVTFNTRVYKIPKAKCEGFYKCLKYSKDCRSHWLKYLTCFRDSSMVLLGNMMQVVSLGIKNWVSKL